MRRSFIITVLGVFAFCSPALAADISGNWQLDLEGPAGPETIQMQIRVDGEKVMLEGEHSIFGDLKGSGTLKGNVISFVISIDGVKGPGHPDGTTVTWYFDGTVEGNKMGGTKVYKAEGKVLEVEAPNTWTAEKR